MLEILLATLPSLLPQDPPAAPTAAPTTTTATAAAPSVPARWLPDTTLAALLIEPSTEGPLAAFWDSPEARALADLALTNLRPGLAVAKLTEADLTAAARGGLALGFVGFAGAKQPDIVLVAELGTATPAIATRFAELPIQGNLRVLGTGPTRLFFGTRERHVAIGTDAATVTATLARATEATGQSLADGIDFARSRATANGTPLAQLFVRLGDLTASSLDRLPTEFAATARRVTSVLGIGDMHWASTTWLLDGSELASHSRLEASRGDGLLDALCGTTGRIDASLARLVPTGSSGYGFFTVQFGTAFDELLALANAVQPAMAKGITAQLDQISDRAGIDLRADIVGGFAGRLVTYAAADGGFVTMFELRQGTAFGRALDKLLGSLPQKPEQGTIAGTACWRGPNGSGPSLAVVGNWLAIGSDDNGLDTAVRQMQEPRTDADVLAFVRSLPADTTAAISAPADVFAALTGTTGTTADAQRRMLVRRDDDGLIAEERTDAAAFLRGTTAALAAMGAKPATTSAIAAVPTTVGRDDPQAAAWMRNAETEGTTRSNVTTLIDLLGHADPAIAARAAWLLGQWKATDAIQPLGDTLRTHADAQVRLQATAALARLGSSATTEPLTRASEDTDARVRLAAIQALSRLGATAVTGPALTLLDRLGGIAVEQVPPDVVAALVALHDVGDPAHLLPAATSIGYSQAQVGQALTFLFQGLSPRLPAADETKTLLAVLAHPEPMLRRYAIQRLGELRDPTAAGALEGRLATESADLQPLIRVSLTQVRGDRDPGADDLVARAKSNVTAISQMLERRWNQLGTTGRIATIASAATVLLLGLGIVVARRRSRRNREVAEAQALVEPSAGYAASSRTTTPRAPARTPVGAGFGDQR